MPKSFQCTECSAGLAAFASEEALLTHKWNMIKQSKRKTHMRCHVCKLDHRTFAGLVRHYQICHPAPQKLSCPGCVEPFDRLHQLMDHLESDKCPSILAERVQQNRMLQVHATNQLAAAAAAMPLGGGSSNSKFLAIEGITGIEGMVGDPQQQTIQDLVRIQSHRDADTDSLLAGADEKNDNAEERPIFDHHDSGVTLGDFGGFINIKPQAAEAMAVACAAEHQHQQLARIGGVGGYPYEQAMGGAVMHHHRVPPTSAEAVEEMLQQQRQQGRSEVVDKGKGKEKANEKGKAKAKDTLAAVGTQSIRAFRQGDAKGPDLLTDDTSPLAQRFKDLQVWAGQESLGIHQGQGGTTTTTSVAGSSPFRTPSVAPSTRRGTVTASSVAGSVVGGGTVGTIGRSRADADRSESDATAAYDDRFIDVAGCRDPYTGRYTCPHEMCQRSGKQYKTAGGLVAHLRSKTAHSTQRQQCPSCFGWFTSLNALTQHIESQSTRCHFRETDEFVPFVNIISAGVADVQGHNADMTLAYAVQPGAAEALVEDGLTSSQAQSQTQDVSVWKD